MVKEWAEPYRDELQEEKIGEDMLRVEDWVYEQNYRLIENLIRGLNLELFHFYVVFLYSVVKLP
jgi:hypothetical protein